MGVFLLRTIPRHSFEKTFPTKRYWRFVASAVSRIILGYLFLINVFFVMVGSRPH